MVLIFKQIKCVEREISKRKYVYPKLIANGKLTQEKADDEIATMEAVKDTLVSIYGQKNKSSGEQLRLELGTNNYNMGH